MSTSHHTLLAIVAMLAAAMSPGLAIAEPPAPPPLSKTISADDLVASAKQYVQDLAAATTDEKTFTASTDKIVHDANTLIVIALVLAKHDTSHPLKASAAAMIAPAQKLAKAKDYNTAREAMAAVKTALDGKAPAVSEPQWSKLASMGKVMEQVGTINTKLRNSLRRLDPKRTDDNARAATVIAAVGQAIVYDTHEVKNPDDLPNWYALSGEMRDAAGALSAAIRAGDKAAATEASTRVMKNCDTCHEAFQ